MIQEIIAAGDPIKHQPDRAAAVLRLRCPRAELQGGHGYWVSPGRLANGLDGGSASASVTSSATTALPMPCSRTKRRTPARFFLSPAAVCSRRLED